MSGTTSPIFIIMYTKEWKHKPQIVSDLFVALDKQKRHFGIFLSQFTTLVWKLPFFFFLSDFFNWTATYRDDSDLQRPYGWIEPKEKPFIYAPKWKEVSAHWKEHPFDKVEYIKTLPQTPESFRKLAERPKLVAWIVSNCHSNSNREDYVKELRKYIPVGIGLYAQGLSSSPRTRFGLQGWLGLLAW